MRVVGARLRLETGTSRLGLDLRGQRGDLFLTRPQTQPDHPRHAAALERSDVAESQLERPHVPLREAVGDSLRDRELDLAEEANRQVQVFLRRPAKLRRPLRALGQITCERGAMSFGQRKPEERADLYRPAFVQWLGAQAPGALGRQPN